MSKKVGVLDLQPRRRELQRRGEQEREAREEERLRRPGRCPAAVGVGVDAGDAGIVSLAGESHGPFRVQNSRNRSANRRLANAVEVRKRETKAEAKR